MTGTICKLDSLQLMMQGVTCRDWICISQLYRLEKKRHRKGEGGGFVLLEKGGLSRGQGWKFPLGSLFWEELLEFICNYTQE